MTDRKLLKLFGFYDDYLHAHFGARREEDTSAPVSARHLRYMCGRAMLDLVPNDHIEKAMRWLGFIQGALAAKSSFSLDELKDHARPDPDEVDLKSRDELFKEATDKLAALEAEIDAVCDLTGCRIDCREGGGPENLAGTLALTVHRLRDENRLLRRLCLVADGERVVSVDEKSGSYVADSRSGRRTQYWPRPEY